MARSETVPVQEPVRSKSNRKVISRSGTHNTHASSSRKPDVPPSNHKLPILHRGDVEPSRANGAAAPRPGGMARQNSVQTRYMDMLLALDTIPRLHNILATFFTWLLLAGFIVFPGTFTSIAQDDALQNDATAQHILDAVKNVDLIIVAGVACGIGCAGMCWLWIIWRRNYVWLLNRIFLPGTLNSFAGLISTLINVYSQQGGTWSITAKVTAIVTGACMTVTAVLFALYNFWILERVKRSHGRDMEMMRSRDETFGEKVERKAMEPALEPGSVV